jgi:hypothetical protein
MEMGRIICRIAGFTSYSFAARRKGVYTIRSSLPDVESNSEGVRGARTHLQRYL